MLDQEELSVTETVGWALHSNGVVGPITDYRLLAIVANGQVNVVEVLEKILNWIRKSGVQPALLLGPTTPFDSKSFKGIRIGWVTTPFPMDSSPSAIEFHQLDPYNLLDISLFVSTAWNGIGTSKKIVVGDFLDSVFASHNSSETLFTFLSRLKGQAAAGGRTAILVVNEGIHERWKMEILRRFADVVIDVDGTGPIKTELSRNHDAFIP